MEQYPKVWLAMDAAMFIANLFVFCVYASAGVFNYYAALLMLASGALVLHYYKRVKDKS